MLRLMLGIAGAAFLLAAFDTTPADAAGRKVRRAPPFRVTCVGPVPTYHECWRLIGRDVRGNPIRVRPAPPRRVFVFFGFR